MRQQGVDVAEPLNAAGEIDRRFRDLVEQSQDLVSVIDQAGTILYASPAISRLIGLEPDESIGACVLDSIHRDDMSDVVATLAQAFSDPGVVHTSRFRMLGMTGSYRYVESTGVAYRDAEERLRGLVLTRDITARKSAEDALEKSEEQFQAVAESTSDAILLVNAEKRIVLWNNAAQEMFGYAQVEALGAPLVGLLPDRHRCEHDSYLDRVLSSGINPLAGKTVTVSARKKDGSEFPAELSVGFWTAAGEPRFSAIVRDVTERKEFENQLRRSEADYRSIFENAVHGIFRSTQDGRFLSVNAALIKMLGYDSKEELMDIDLRSDLYEDPDERSRILGALTDSDGNASVEAHWKRKDGTSVIVQLDGRTVLDESGEVECFEVIAEDVTEKRDLETQLRLAQKLEAVGQLAAGIAHEINTPMQYVGDNVHFLESAMEDFQMLLAKYQKARDALADGPGNEALLKEIAEAEEDADLPYLEEYVPRAFERTLEGIERVTGIVRAMKEFSHPDQREASPIDMNKALKSTLTVARNEYKYVADVETDFGELPLVTCLAGDINQVFLNLLVNAAHAIGDVKGEGEEKGKIFLRTEQESEDTVLIAVRDTGGGIPEKIAQRVFDPFFTTKEIGKGTGQGLAIARSVVVEKHGGSLTFEVDPGVGTEFFIRLPISGVKPDDELEQ